MNSNEKLLDQWLAGGGLEQDNTVQDVWEPGFEAGQRVVIAQLGPYQKIFEWPTNFVKRFYHSVYPLPIDDWQLQREIKLYGGFCHIGATLELRFQATFKYAQTNSDVLAEINEYVKNNFQGLIFDLLNKELHALDNGQWIKYGLREVEKRIDNGINEMMLLKNIRCRTVTSLTAEFADIEDNEQIDAHFVNESVYLNVVQKNFEFHGKQQQQQFRQQQQEDNLKLQQHDHEQEWLRKQQAQKAENIRKRLLEKEQQQNDQHIVEKRIHNESTHHVIKLRELAAEAELQEKEDKRLREQKTEQKMLIQKIAHESRLQEKQMLDEIKEHEKKELQWSQAKQRLHDEKLAVDKQLKQKEHEMALELEEIRQLDELKKQERMEIEKIMLDNRLKDMHLEANVVEQKKRFDATNRSADYLRREIELLVLEKQRAELNLAIKKARQEDEGLE